jgi:hypothetical protein
VKLKKLYFPAAYTEFYSDFGYIWQNFYYVDPRNPFLTSQINKTSIALQYYKGQRIAPVGRYFELGFNFLTAQVLSNQEFIQNYNWNGSLYAANSQSIQIDKKKTKQKMRSIFFGIGRGKVLKHGMYFSTAVRFHFPFISFSDGDIDLPLKNYNGEEADKLVLDGNQTQVGFTRMDESILEPGEPGEEGYYYIRSRLYHYLFANEMFEIRFSIGKVF